MARGTERGMGRDTVTDSQCLRPLFLSNKERRLLT